MAVIIDGKLVSKKIKKSIKQEIDKMKENAMPVPGLAVILVGDDQASQVYVRNKERACSEVGIRSTTTRMNENTTEQQLLLKIEELNNNKDVHGILVQLPLPKHIDENNIINAISADKDVDGFHPVNRGKLLTGNCQLEPCTAKGIIRLIEETGQSISGKHAVVVGRSNNVGKSVALMLLKNDATVTVAHSKTENLSQITKQADILIVAVGEPHLIDKSFVKEGAIVIDVGINRVDGKLAGDVDFDDVVEKAAYITPVPGGVGPMTVTILLDNTLLAAKKVL